MTHGSLFSGIGGFDLAAEWSGFQNAFHCEKNPLGRKILNHYWPESISYEDITKTDFAIHQGKIDILSGGFPCQPFSVAGKRKGTEDSRHLWPEMLRAIREIRPRWIVGENVRGLLSWSSGLVFESVCTDLEAEGYEVQPFILPDCAVNAPHRRDRIWFVAYASNKRCNHRIYYWQKRSLSLHEKRIAEKSKSEGHKRIVRPCPAKWFRHATHTQRKRQPEQRQPKRSLHKETDRKWKASWSYYDGRWPTESPVCSGNDGLSSRLDGITLSKWRQESIAAYGNAIVPQVAALIFESIKHMEILKELPTETLKKMLNEIKEEIALVFIRAELLRRNELV